MMVKSDPNFYIIGWVSLIWVGRKNLDGQPRFFRDIHRENLVLKKNLASPM
jgi:hypothetical protein